jgi:hypothetical protein
MPTAGQPNVSALLAGRRRILETAGQRCAGCSLSSVPQACHTLPKVDLRDAVSRHRKLSQRRHEN